MSQTAAEITSAPLPRQLCAPSADYLLAISRQLSVQPIIFCTRVFFSRQPYNECVSFNTDGAHHQFPHIRRVAHFVVTFPVFSLYPVLFPRIAAFVKAIPSSASPTITAAAATATTSATAGGVYTSVAQSPVRVAPESGRQDGTEVRATDTLRRPPPPPPEPPPPPPDASSLA